MTLYVLCDSVNKQHSGKPPLRCDYDLAVRDPAFVTAQKYCQVEQGRPANMLRAAHSAYSVGRL